MVLSTQGTSQLTLKKHTASQKLRKTRVSKHEKNWLHTWCACIPPAVHASANRYRKCQSKMLGHTPKANAF